MNNVAFLGSGCSARRWWNTPEGHGSSPRHPTLNLVVERKLADFISPPTPGGVFEASGVIAKGAHYYVIYDNVRHIARIHRSIHIFAVPRRRAPSRVLQRKS